MNRNINTRHLKSDDGDGEDGEEEDKGGKLIRDGFIVPHYFGPESLRGSTCGMTNFYKII